MNTTVQNGNSTFASGLAAEPGKNLPLGAFPASAPESNSGTDFKTLVASFLGNANHSAAPSTQATPAKTTQIADKTPARNRKEDDSNRASAVSVANTPALQFTAQVIPAPLQPLTAPPPAASQTQAECPDSSAVFTPSPNATREAGATKADDAPTTSGASSPVMDSSQELRTQNSFLVDTEKLVKLAPADASTKQPKGSSPAAESLGKEKSPAIDPGKAQKTSESKVATPQSHLDVPRILNEPRPVQPTSSQNPSIKLRTDSHQDPTIRPELPTKPDQPGVNDAGSVTAASPDTNGANAPNGAIPLLDASPLSSSANPPVTAVPLPAEAVTATSQTTAPGNGPQKIANAVPNSQLLSPQVLEQTSKKAAGLTTPDSASRFPGVGQKKDPGRTEPSTKSKGSSADNRNSSVTQPAAANGIQAGKQDGSAPQDRLATSDKPAQSAVVADPSAKGVPAKAAGDDTQAPQGSALDLDGPDASTSQMHSVVNTAKLAQSLSQAEFRIGMQTRELGSIDIRTSLAAHTFTAQIFVEHGEAAKTLTSELPGLYARLADHQVLTGPIQIHTDGMSTSAGFEQGRKHEASRPFEPSQRLAGFEPETKRMSSFEVAAASDRLDIRI